MNKPVAGVGQSSTSSRAPLACLIVEDNPDDAELMVMYLSREGFDVTWQRVDNEADYLDALTKPYDLILSDWSLPQFSGLKALELVQQLNLEIPFMIVSGEIGDETAVALMHQGAADYVWKDRMGRLGQAVKKTLERHSLQIANEKAIRALEASEAELRALFSAMRDVIFVLDEFGVFQKVAIPKSEISQEMPRGLLGKNIRDVFPPSDAERFIRHIHNALESQQLQVLEYYVPHEFRMNWFQASISPISTTEVLWVARVSPK